MKKTRPPTFPSDMAERNEKTRRSTASRVTFEIAPIKPRNPLVAPALKRVAGPHRKSASAMRAAERLALQRAIDEKDRSDD